MFHDYSYLLHIFHNNIYPHTFYIFVFGFLFPQYLQYIHQHIFFLFHHRKTIFHYLYCLFYPCNLYIFFLLKKYILDIRLCIHLYIFYHKLYILFFFLHQLLLHHHYNLLYKEEIQLYYKKKVYLDIIHDIAYIFLYIQKYNLHNYHSNFHQNIFYLILHNYYIYILKFENY